MEKTKKIILPGGAGLVGQNLVARLKSRGYTNICVLDKHTANLAILSEVHPDITTVYADLAEAGDWTQHFDGAEVVVMLQAQIGGIAYDDFERNNVSSTSRVLDAIKSYDVPYLVHISSSVVESSADDFYTNSKKEQEEMVLASGISCPILRPTLMFGWFDRKHLGWLSRFMKKALFFRCPAADATCANPYMLAIFAALSSAASRTGSKMVFTTSPVMSRSTTSTLLKRSSEQRARARPS
jgi:nucleoside-diphosphate-sugar epimerase